MKTDPKEEVFTAKEVQGELLFKVEEVLTWSIQEIEDYLMVLTECYSEGKLSITVEKIHFLEGKSKEYTVIDTIVKRINRPSDAIDFNYRSFAMRFSSTFRIVKKAIEKNPSLISPVTVGKLRFLPQFKWLDLLFDTNGAPSQFSRGNNSMQVIATITPAQRLVDAMEHVANVYEMIGRSITLEDIQKLKTMDKINALKSLSYIHTSIGKFKPSKKFTEMKPESQSRESLEASLLDIGEEEE